ncbi:MAG: hypothetical protein JWR10_3407 [Rubritepida sp.]|nr:hypothetical protein [Rubritepida sp.]
MLDEEASSPETPYVVFVNGPPRAGKDTLANAVANRLGARPVKFAGVLKERTHAAYGLHYAPHGHFEACKDQPRDEFLGITPRQAYIAFSEQMMKPLHGAGVFGRMLLDDMLFHKLAAGFIVSDSGFAAEAAPVVERFGAINCLLLRIWRSGHDFSGDSRSYIELPSVETLEVSNNDTEALFRRIGLDAVQDWMERRAALGAPTDGR